MTESSTYFTTIFPKIVKGTILDFGFGQSPFIDNELSIINHLNYTGVDTDEFIVSQASDTWPETEFIHHDPTSNVFVPNEKFYDVAISYQSLTNCDINTFFTTIRFLYDKVKPGGYLLLNFLDQDDQPTVEHYQKLRIEEFGSCDDLSTPKWKYLIDNRIAYEKLNGKYFNLFLNKNFILKELDSYNIQFRKSYHLIPNIFFSYMFIEKL